MSGFQSQWINDCKYDAAGLLLKHIYGYSKPTQQDIEQLSPAI